MEKELKISVRRIITEYFKGLKGYMTPFILSVVFTLIAQILNVFIPYLYKNFFNIINLPDTKEIIAKQLIHIILLIAGLNFAGWIFYRASFFLLNHTEANTMSKIKQISFNYLIKHSHSFFTNSFTGGLVQKVNRQARAFERIFDTLIFNFLPLFITVIGAIIITFFTSKILSLVILCWVVLFSAMSLVFYRWKMKFDLEVSKVDSETTALLSDNISNNQTISLFNGYEREIESYTKATEKQAKIIIRTWDYGGFYDSFQILLVFAAEFFIFYFAIKYWAAGIITVGGIVMVQIYVISIAKQIWTINMVLRNVFESLADSKEMVEILDTPHEIKNVPNATELKVTKGEIEFKDVSFNFDEARNVLEHINCIIKPGEKIALIGPSGAGKTTFVRLILRLYNISKGQILIDNQDISQSTQESLRENISLVPQDPILFHRTLKENIRYGKPGATDEEVIDASKLAHCEDFIEVLPAKYDTLVGERGIKLSGGERQRIAIARAILKNAPILILDEATSSLDSHSEALIQKALDNLMKNRTTIVIAHRLSTIRKMDRILVMEDGKIIEEGTHEELANKNSGLYKDLWELQAGGFIQK
jgi:ATP-binding cassette, subfamily B, bacterial